MFHISAQLMRPHFLLRPPTGDDYVLSLARGIGVALVSVANHCPRLDSLDAGRFSYGSCPWQIDLYMAGRGHDLWPARASGASHSRPAARWQNKPSCKLGHSLPYLLVGMSNPSSFARAVASLR
jgi:hypothetical protein